MAELPLPVVEWLNPANAKADDGSEASVLFEKERGESKWLWATTYGLSIPTTATLAGIVVTADYRGENIVEKIGGGLKEYRPPNLAYAQLIVGGALAGTKKELYSGAFNLTGPLVFGGSADLWGYPALTRTQAQATGFGVALKLVGEAKAYVDVLSLALYYSVPVASGRPRLFVTNGKFVWWAGPEAKAEEGFRQSEWQSGFYDLSNQEEKSLVESVLWGQGEVTLSSYKDFSDTPGFTESYALGSSISQKRGNGAQTGALFSHRLVLAAESKVHRLTRYLRETRAATTKTGTK